MAFHPERFVETAISPMSNRINTRETMDDSPSILAQFAVVGKGVLEFAGDYLTLRNHMLQRGGPQASKTCAGADHCTLSARPDVVIRLWFASAA
jgi:hypothetical protein